MKSNSKHKAFALTKTRAAPLIAAALMMLIALFGITACPNNVEGGAVTGTANGGNTGGLEWHEAPLIEGGASLILSPDKLTIRVTVTTSDNSPITVEGCDKTELTSGTQTELKAKNTGVVLKGKITKLICFGNKLTALNVQGLNALNHLNCDSNQLTALNVQGLSALRGLSCSGNKLTALNVQGLNALQRLYCYNNQLTALNVQGLNALQNLSCFGNKLTALNVQGLSAVSLFPEQLRP
ncbi:MAG: leucine-rich repeat domain-containing protein, partial [Treponema lecithinolyticum]